MKTKVSSPSLVKFFCLCLGLVTLGHCSSDSLQCKNGTLSVNGKCVAQPEFTGIADLQITSGGVVQVNWQPAVDSSTSVAKMVYKIYIATRPGEQNYTIPQYTTPAGATSISVRNLTVGIVYYFVVRAVNKYGVEDQNILEKSIKLSGDIKTPQFGGLLFAESKPGNTILLSWNAAWDGEDGTPSTKIIYNVYHTTQSGQYDFSSPLLVSSPGVTTITLQDIDAQSSHFWIVRAKDEAGNEDKNQVEKTAQTAAVSFQGDIVPLLKNNCASRICHGRIDTDPNFSNDAQIYTNLVNQPVSSNPNYRIKPVECNTSGLIRVVPKCPEGSFLYQKITGQQMNPGINNTQMPPMMPLSTIQQELVQKWIAQGALNN